MDAFETYKIYVAIKNHFTVESYNYFKYGKKSKINFDTFMKRKDKLFFAKLGNRKGDFIEDFLVANFIHDTKIWIGELLSDSSETRYKEWKKKNESLTYHFTNEVDFIANISSEEFDNMFKVNSGEHPKIILNYLQGELSIETLIILDSMLNFIQRYDKMIHDPVFKEVSNLCKKYRPFLRFEQAKMKLVVKNKLNLK